MLKYQISTLMIFNIFSQYCINTDIYTYNIEKKLLILSHSFDSPCQPSTHPFLESFLEFYCVHAQCTCIFASFFWWWKVGHGLGLGFWGCLWHNMDIALFEGGTWSRSSWQMPYSIHWCLGSYIGIWGSVMHLHTSLHCVCSISVFTTTTSVTMCMWHQLGPLQWVWLSTFHQCREFKVKGEKWVAKFMPQFDGP